MKLPLLRDLKWEGPSSTNFPVGHPNRLDNYLCTSSWTNSYTGLEYTLYKVKRPYHTESHGRTYVSDYLELYCVANTVTSPGVFKIVGDSKTYKGAMEILTKVLLSP